MELAIISNYLETTSGRDKVFRLLSYAAKLLTACTSSRSTEQKLNIFSKQMSECRVMIRLLDDVPALHDAIAYGWGNKVLLLIIKVVLIPQLVLMVVN